MNTSDQFDREERAARRQRLLYIFFGLGMATSVVICAVLLFLVTKPEIKSISLGSVDRFPLGVPIDVAVKRLETSKLIPSSAQLSEDVIYVVKQSDGSFQALLGLDPVAGCFLSWQPEQQRYIGCTTFTYNPNGINTEQVSTSASRPANMVAFPTEVRDNVLYIKDQILRRDIR